MAEAKFYILPTQSQQERYVFACRVIEKAFRNQLCCYVSTDTAQQSQVLDNLLWTFRPGSFVPHEIYEGKTPEFEQTILIGSQAVPENWKKMIVNLSSHYPDDLAQTDLVVEVLDNSAEIKQAGRKRYRQYVQAEFEITTHKI